MTKMKVVRTCSPAERNRINSRLDILILGDSQSRIPVKTPKTKSAISSAERSKYPCPCPQGPTHVPSASAAQATLLAQNPLPRNPLRNPNHSNNVKDLRDVNLLYGGMGLRLMTGRCMRIMTRRVWRF